jgi:type II secretion system protein G
MLKRKTAQGFSLMELPVVVVIIGIIAAMVIPNLLSAFQKRRQKQTMVDMKKLGNVIETVNTDCGAYPGDTNVGTDCVTPGTLMQGLLKGGWTLAPILCDGWHRPFRYGGAGETGGTRVVLRDPNCLAIFTAWQNTYGLLSKGRDFIEDCGMPKFDPRRGGYVPRNATCYGSPCAGFTHFNCDISFAGGRFVSFPEGMQK